MMGFLIMSATLLLLVGGLYIVSFLISVTNRNISKLSAYECGFDSFGDARVKFDLLYYLIAILYLIFDLELIFLFPMATILFGLGSLLAFWTAMGFLTLLTIGFIYEWFQGALDIVD